MERRDAGNVIMEEEVEAASVCSLLYVDRTIAIACYDETENSILIEHMSCGLDALAETLHCIKIALHPTLYLVHPNIFSNEGIMNLLRSDSERGDCEIKLIRSSSWNAETAKYILSCKVVLESSRTQKSPEKALMFLSSFIDFDSPILLRAMSALLLYIQDKFFHLDQDIISLTSIRPLKMEEIMKIDHESFKALHIFSEDFHPNVIKGKGKSKEGYSLFALFDRTVSSVGRATLRSWMLRPFCNKEKILKRQEGVHFTIKSTNIQFIGHVFKLLRHFSDLPRILLKIKKVSSTYKEWLLIYKSLCAGLDIVNTSMHFIQESVEEIDKEIVKDLFSLCNMETLSNLASHLNSSVDFELSEECKIIMIRDGYNLTLDKMRDTFDNLPMELNRLKTRSTFS